MSQKKFDINSSELILYLPIQGVVVIDDLKCENRFNIVILKIQKTNNFWTAHDIDMVVFVSLKSVRVLCIFDLKIKCSNRGNS